MLVLVLINMSDKEAMLTMSNKEAILKLSDEAMLVLSFLFSSYADVC